MSEQELPPWLREQVSRLQQLQQNLQAIMMQKQQLEVESVETDRALEELKKAGPDDAVYKNAGSVLVKAKKEDVIKELEEKKELSNTRVMVLGKQETRVKENLKEVETKINEMVRGMQGGATAPDDRGRRAAPHTAWLPPLPSLGALCRRRRAHSPVDESGLAGELDSPSRSARWRQQSPAESSLVPWKAPFFSSSPAIDT